MKLRHLLFSCVLLGSLGLSERAFAGSNPAAEALFEKGREAMAAGDYDTACNQLRESDRLEPAVGTRFNLANCEEKRGRLGTAWTLFKSVLNDLPASDDRRPYAEERVEALDKSVPRVTLVPNGETDGVKVVIGDLELGSGSFNVSLALNPGTHKVVVRSPGADPQELELTLEVGESREFTFETKADPSKAGAATDPTKDAGPEPAPGASGGGGTRTLGWIIGGVGLVGLGVGTYAGVKVLSNKQIANDECWPPQTGYPEGGCTPKGDDATTEGRRMGPIATAGLALGVVGLTVGTILILSGGGDKTETALVTRASPDGGSLELSGTF